MSHRSERPALLPGTAQPLRTALDGSEPLSRLLARVHASRERLVAVFPGVPEELRALVEAGPLDDNGWTLLVANAAVAAKLRQLLPVLGEALRVQGLEVAAIRIKVQPPK